MTYRSYEARIQRIAVLTRGIRKCAKLIAVVLLTALVGTGGYLFARGLTIGGVSCEPVLTFGQPIELSALVLLETPTYEYAPQDSEEWTTQQPVMPGNYRVRAVTQRSFGFISHSKPTSFTIEPKKITVTVHEDTLNYGDVPTVSGDVREGDEVRATGLEYPKLSLNPTLIHIPEGNVSIVNQNGDDVTSAYVITTKDKVVDITPRPITVTVPGGTKEYDGTPLHIEEWSLTAGSLMEGDVLSMSFPQSVTYVTDGVVENTPGDISICTADGIDVRTHYEITFACGSLSVTPRTIPFSTNTVDWVYGHSPKPFIIENENDLPLPEGHTLGKVEFIEIPVDAGTYTNTCGFTILNAAGKDVTEGNFILEPTFGTITIAPLPLILTTPNAEKEYDGRPLTSAYVDVKPGQQYLLVEGHTLEVAVGSAAEQTDVGEIENSMVVRVLDGKGNDVTANYDLSYECGTLTVIPRPVVIFSGSAEKIYDGIPLTTLKVEEADGLVTGHEIKILHPVSLTRVGSIQNGLTKESLVIQTATGRDVTANYSIEFGTPGTLRVKPLPMTVQTPSGTFTYDGMPHSMTQGITFAEGSLPDGHVFSAAGDPASITNVGTVANEFGILIRNGEGSDVTDCFDLTYLYGELIVNRRPLTITPKSGRKTYDGTALVGEYIQDGLLEALGHTLILPAGINSITNVGSTPNILPASGYQIMAGEEDVTNNYEVTVDNAGDSIMLTIDPRPITVSPEYAQKGYDGLPLTGNVPVYDTEALVEGHRVVIETDGYMINVDDETRNSITATTIYDALGVDVTRNYAITTKDGALSILPRAITVQMSDGEWVYADVEQSSPSFTVTSEHDLVEGQSWAGILSSSIRDVVRNGAGEITTIPNELLGYAILSGTEDVTRNYTVTALPGTLKVTPKPLHISTHSANRDYNGEPLICRDFDQEGLLDGHTVVVNASTELVRTGSASNSFTDIVITRDADGVAVTDNYKVTYTEGELQVYRLYIVVQTQSGTFVYDGLEHSLTGGISSDDLPAGHEIRLSQAPTIVNVGEVVNAIQVEVFNARGENVTDCFNVVDRGYGTLTVVQRPIQITSSNTDAPFIYDGTAHTYNVGQWIDDPENDQEGLVSGHVISLVTGGAQIFANTLDPDSVAANNPIESAILTDAAGNDVTANYAMTFVAGTIWVDPRPITVYPRFETKEYDGTPLTGNVPMVKTEGDLLNGHVIEILTNGSQTLAGQSSNEVVSFLVYDSADGSDVTANYAPTFERSILDVTPRKLTIKTGSSAKVYDGLPLYCTDYESADRLLDGHVITPIDYTRITDAGLTVDNEWTVIITEEGADVTESYEISWEYGTLTVTHAEIAVITPSGSFVYDGTAHSVTDGIILDSALPTGYTYAVNELTELVGVDSRENVLSIRILDAVGNDVTEQFVLTYTYGTLTVTPRPIQITSSNTDAPFIYDGTAHTYDVGQWIDDPWHDAEGLVSGHAISLVTGGAQILANTLDPASVAANNPIISATLTDAAGNDVTANYAITYVDGTIWVDPRPIRVAPKDETKVFDDLPLTGMDYVVRSAESDLLEGHYFELVTQGEQILYGTSDNVIIAYTIWDADGNDVTANYAVTTETGLLSVTRAPLSITTGSSDMAYNGLPLMDTSFTADGLLSGHTVTPQSWTQVIFDTNIENRFESLTITRDSDGTDVTECYDVTYIYGVLNVYPANVTIKTPSQTFTYDGLPHSYTDGMTVDLPDGHTWEITGWQYVWDVTTPVTNEVTILVRDANGNDVTDRFTFTGEFGTLSMIPRRILVTANNEDAPSIYDGTAQSYHVGTVLDSEGYESLVGGHIIAVTTSTTLTMPGVADNVIESVRVFDADGQDVTANYVIDTATGKISIIPRELTIAPLDMVKEYDGSELIPGNTANILNGSLVSGHRIEIVAVGSQTGVGTSGSSIDSWTIYDEAGNDVSRGYAVSLTNGLLTVDCRVISVQTNSGSKIYDGTPLTVGGYELVSPQQLLEGHVFSASVITEVTDAGNYLNNGIHWSVMNGDEDVSDYYELALIPGELVIEPISITVTTPSAGMEYSGEPLMATDCIVSAGALLDGHQFTVSSWLAPTEIGTYENACTIVITDANGNDVTQNYTIHYVNGTLTIREPKVRIPISISPYEIKVTYDGNEHGPEGDEFWISEGSLPAGYSITNVVYNGRYTNAGSYVSFVTSATILNELGEDVTDDYKFTFPEVPLIIEHRELIIETGSLSVGFDSKVHSNKTYKVTGGVMIDGHDLDITMSTTIKDRGTVYNVIDRLAITDANGEVILDTAAPDAGNFTEEIIDEATRIIHHTNYVIRLHYGQLTVRW